MPAPRIGVLKTPKLFIGGAFPRTESGRTLPALGPDGKVVLARICRASRKDLRDAVVAARRAFPGWSGKTAYLRGQILYRMAELLEARRAELASELRRSTGATAAAADRQAGQTVDRLVHYAGWSDKFAQVFGSVNPVASPHFNFTVPEPTGVVVVLCPDEAPLLGLAALAAPALVSGNAVIALASERHPLPAIPFAEVAATSDLPGGALNILTGLRAELAPHIASHRDIDAVVDASGDKAIGKTLQEGVATNLKRVTLRARPARGWASPAAEDPRWILDTVELKTTWHPVGV
jgi:acyl-CoA reductase-like NAD-dependent aldehyde dehydrogenase